MIKRILRIRSQHFFSSFLDLSLSLLSLSHIFLDTYNILGALQHWRKEGKGRTSKQEEAKYQGRKSKIKQLQWDYLQVSSCMYDFLAIFGTHGKCMHVFGSLVIIGIGFVRCDNVFSLSLSFLDSHGVMAFSCFD